MYRQDRIGPWPLITLSSPNFDAADPTTNSIDNAVTTQVNNAVANEALMSESMRFDLLSVPFGQQCAVGVKILGNRIFEQDEYLIAVAGAVAFATDHEGLIVHPVIGRQNTNGAVATTMSIFSLVPAVNTHHPRSSGAEFSAYQVSCNMELVIGDWEPLDPDPPEENEIFFGFWFQNKDPNTDVTLENVWVTCSIHRYLEDLKPFDPNR